MPERLHEASFRTEDPQMSDATLHSLVAMATRRPEFVRPWRRLLIHVLREGVDFKISNAVERNGSVVSKVLVSCKDYITLVIYERDTLRRTDAMFMAEETEVLGLKTVAILVCFPRTPHGIFWGKHSVILLEGQTYSYVCFRTLR